MDEIKINSTFMTDVISRILTRVVQKKLNSDPEIQINGVTATLNEGRIHVHIDADIDLGLGTLSELLLDKI